MVDSFLAAVQFLTRIPVPRATGFSTDALAKATMFFPLVGALIGGGGVLLNWWLSPHMSRSVIVVLILVYLVTLTGGLHEDALADAADGFGGGWKKDQILGIMRDSRVGSFGAIAISFSLLARFVFLTNLAPEKFAGFLVAGQVLGRWTALPLAFFLPSARGGESGQGTLIARKITAFSFAVGTILTIGIVTFALKGAAVWALLSAVAMTAASGIYYRARIGGITGDCLGATTQLTEAGIYLLGVLLP